MGIEGIPGTNVGRDFKAFLFQINSFEMTPVVISNFFISFVAVSLIVLFSKTFKYSM